MPQKLSSKELTKDLRILLPDQVDAFKEVHRTYHFHQLPDQAEALMSYYYLTSPVEKMYPKWSHSYRAPYPVTNISLAAAQAQGVSRRTRPQLVESKGVRRATPKKGLKEGASSAIEINPRNLGALQHARTLAIKRNTQSRRSEIDGHVSSLSSSETPTETALSEKMRKISIKSTQKS